MVIPSRCQIGASPVDSPGGCCFPSRVSVSISPVKSSGICEDSRSRIRIDIPSKAKTVVSPQSVGGSYPQQFPERIGCKGGSSPARVTFSQQQMLLPSKVEIGVLTSSSMECLVLPSRIP
jgi:hypothetical protein